MPKGKPKRYVPEENADLCLNCTVPGGCDEDHPDCKMTASFKKVKRASPKGKERHSLTAEQVRSIRREYDEGVSRNNLARKYGVSYQAVWDITTGRSWRKLDAQG